MLIIVPSYGGKYGRQAKETDWHIMSCSPRAGASARRGAGRGGRLRGERVRVLLPLRQQPPGTPGEPRQGPGVLRPERQRRALPHGERRHRRAAGALPRGRRGLGEPQGHLRRHLRPGHGEQRRVVERRGAVHGRRKPGVFHLRLLRQALSGLRPQGRPAGRLPEPPRRRHNRAAPALPRGAQRQLRRQLHRHALLGGAAHGPAGAGRDRELPQDRLRRAADRVGRKLRRVPRRRASAYIPTPRSTPSGAPGRRCSA